MSIRFGAVFLTVSFRTSMTRTGEGSCPVWTRRADFAIAITMPLVRPCPATSPNARPIRPLGEREEVEVVAADLGRGAVVRRDDDARQLRVARREEGGLDPVRGVDLGLDPLALDDPLHVRREVLVAVLDLPAGREAEGGEGEEEEERDEESRGRAVERRPLERAGEGEEPEEERGAEERHGRGEEVLREEDAGRREGRAEAEEEPRRLGPHRREADDEDRADGGGGEEAEPEEPAGGGRPRG